MRPPEPNRSRWILWLLEASIVLGALFSRRPAGRLPRGVDAEDLVEGYEHSDMRASVVLAGALGLLAILGLVLLLVTQFEAAATGLAPAISRPAELIEGLRAAPTPPAPRLEAQSGELFEPYRAAQERKLNSYRWVDRQAGVVGIPIERAIELTAQRGLPARSTSEAQDQGNRSPSSASSGRVDEAYP